MTKRLQRKWSLLMIICLLAGTFSNAMAVKAEGVEEKKNLVV